MNQIAITLVCILLIWICGQPAGGHPVPAVQPPFTIFAASSLTGVLDELAADFSNTNNVSPVISYGSSSTLARQIESGAQTDLFLSAGQEWIDYLLQRQLLQPQSISIIARNQLVIVAPVQATLNYSFTSNQPPTLTGNQRLAMGDPQHVPAGHYTRQALMSLGWWDSLSGHLATGENIRVALRYVETGECPFGIVYRTDALQSRAVTIVGELPMQLHDPIIYTGGLCPDAKPAAATFLHYLHSVPATTIINRYGFLSSTPSPVSTVPESLPVIASTVSTAIDEKTIIALSLKVAFCCTLLAIIPGILLGYLLARYDFPGKSLLNALVHFPLIVPPVVIGYLTLLVLGRNGIVGGWLYHQFGLSLAFTWKAAVIVSAVMGFPFLVRSVRLAVELIDKRLEQAASLLGAGRLKIFFTVTLPLAFPGILSGMILTFARSLGEFGATVVFAGNIPGQTQTLSLAIYSFTQIPGAEPVVLHLAGLSLAIALTAMLISEMLGRMLKTRLARH